MNDLLQREDVRGMIGRHGHDLVAALLREHLATLRSRIRNGSLGADGLPGAVHGLAGWVDQEARSRTRSTLVPVINATGVVLHTNLGRAILSQAVVRRVVEVARAYTTLEYDLDRGQRGSRSSHLERLFALLFPGRAVHVVNNNAAAVLLALNTLAEGREVIVSRGELVEIGGSFRIPEIMSKSGAILREVGTTNKTRLPDYERAINARTGLLLKVHPSNYRITGFTTQAPLREIVLLGRRRGVPVMMDQGSGNLTDLRGWGIRSETQVRDVIAAGADVVCFSGDKLLGGPQAGLLIGRPSLIGRMRANPLTRALRVDKMTQAALEATLQEYVRGAAAERLPVIRMMAIPQEEVERRARDILETVMSRAPGRLSLSLQPGASLLGGGSAPEEGIPTALLAVRSDRLSPRAICERLRRFTPPIIARIEAGRVLIDPRTVPEGEDRTVAEALVALTAT
jgi:L-seryl-tRNA(Ser) seleniumtransferase